jgi:hypothetical protein
MEGGARLRVAFIFGTTAKLRANELRTGVNSAFRADQFRNPRNIPA